MPGEAVTMVLRGLDPGPGQSYVLHIQPVDSAGNTGPEKAFDIRTAPVQAGFDAHPALMKLLLR
ncbi:MAG: hypothetical protein LC660_17795, partial [Desulfobacteraceae bacterium]|nr:hypothetical protein [Desulfobacteraceae bacterium]